MPAASAGRGMIAGRQPPARLGVTRCKAGRFRGRHCAAFAERASTNQSWNWKCYGFPLSTGGWFGNRHGSFPSSACRLRAINEPDMATSDFHQLKHLFDAEGTTFFHKGHEGTSRFKIPAELRRLVEDSKRTKNWKLLFALVK